MKRILIIVTALMMTGCASVKYRKVMHHPDGTAQLEQDAHYTRWFNQKIELGAIRSHDFDLDLSGQEANHDEAIGKAVEGLVEGLK